MLKNISVFAFLILCWMFFLSPVGVSHAFYRSGIESKEVGFQRERHYATKVGKNKTFAIYDNISHFSPRENPEPLTYLTSDHFVPFDTVSIDIPIYIVVGSRKSIDIILGDVVYANLKLKKLLDEYEDSQQRALKVLEGLSIPFLEYHYGVPSQSVARSSAQKGYVETREALVREYGFDARQVLARIWNVSNTKQRYSTGRPIGGIRDWGAERAIIGKGRDIGVVDSESYLPGTRAIPLNGQEPLPWILRLPLGILKYLLSHKIQAILYGVILFFLCTVVMSSRSRGRD